MKMNPELIKMILLAIEDSESAYITLQDIARAVGTEVDEKFIYQCELIADQGLIVDGNGQPNIGIKRDLYGDITISVIKLRLSAAGHDYLGAIKNTDIWNRVMKTAGDFGLKAMIEAAGAAVSEMIKKAF